VVDFVEQQQVPAVFCESTVSDGAQRQVAAQSGARFGGTLYVDSLSEADGPVPTYLDLLRHDLRTIAEGLGGPGAAGGPGER
jgi:manganese transport system substrate-binding protein